jgi:redox-sensitive bicupin YhaK (pirin superfamily)
MGVVGTLCAMLLVACGGGVEGSYFYGEGDEGITLELRGENVAVILISGLSEVEGTYSVDGDNVTVTMPGGDIDVFTIQDGNLTTRAFGEDMVFEKQ